jgi:hypothetical protein
MFSVNCVMLVQNLDTITLHYVTLFYIILSRNEIDFTFLFLLNVPRVFANFEVRIYVVPGGITGPPYIGLHKKNLVLQMPITLAARSKV